MNALTKNLESYSSIYGERRTFLRYPADWIIRFHNIYLRKHIPSGKILDFGCGSGNNIKFFRDQGYETFGTEITDACLPLIRENVGDIDGIQILQPDLDRLPFPDNHFDFVLSNQVLYYLADRTKIRAISEELKRVLRPGGAVFFTMIGPKNYYIADGYAKPIGDDAYEMKMPGDHRLAGFNQVFYVVRDETDLLSLFSAFDPLTVGHFDQSMFDLKSNFHWIFAGTKS